VVTHWHPRLDLARLLDALAEEILAATDEEVRAAAAQGRKIASAAREVRLLVRTACADVDEDLDRNLNNKRQEDDLNEVLEPGAGPRPTGAHRRPSHHQRH
jgi:hypothetical protein